MTVRAEKAVFWGKYCLWKLCHCLRVEERAREKETTTKAERETETKSRQIETNAERQGRGREWAWQSICVRTYTPTSESDNETQSCRKKESERGRTRMTSFSSQLSDILYLWLLLAASILNFQSAEGVFLPTRPDGWVKQMEHILFVVEVLF